MGDVQDRADGWDEVAGSYGSAPVFGWFAEALVEMAAVEHGARLLDLGTGTGACLASAASASATRPAVGVDFSSAMLRAARTRVESAVLMNTDFVRADVTALPFGDASFDIALASSVWQFVNYSSSALVEWRRVLRSRGRLALSIPRATSGAGIAGDLVAKYFRRLPQAAQDRLLASGAPQSFPDVGSAVIDAGFTSCQVETRRWVDTMDDAEAWWDGQWKHGIRNFLRELPAEDLGRLKQEAISRLDRAPTGEITVTIEFVLCVAYV